MPLERPGSRKTALNISTPPSGLDAGKTRQEDRAEHRRCSPCFDLLAAAIAALWLFGSRTPVDTTVRFDPRAIGDDLDADPSGREATVDGIRPGLSKQIVWLDPDERDYTSSPSSTSTASPPRPPRSVPCPTSSPANSAPTSSSPA